MARTASSVITDARQGQSGDLRRRQRNYLISMGIRTACFLALVLINLSTHFLTYSAALDVFASRDLSWQTVADWTPHKQHAHPDPAPVPILGKWTAATVGSATPASTALLLASSSTAAPSMDSSNVVRVAAWYVLPHLSSPPCSPLPSSSARPVMA